MWRPKGCSRCGGDLYQTSTEDGEVLSCLQCGREVLLAERIPTMSREQVLALFHEDDEDWSPRAA